MADLVATRAAGAISCSGMVTSAGRPDVAPVEGVAVRSWVVDGPAVASWSKPSQATNKTDNDRIADVSASNLPADILDQPVVIVANVSHIPGFPNCEFYERDDDTDLFAASTPLKTSILVDLAVVIVARGPCELRIGINDQMRRLLVSASMAIITGILACGTATTAVLPTVTPSPSPTIIATPEPESNPTPKPAQTAITAPTAPSVPASTTQQPEPESAVETEPSSTKVPEPSTVTIDTATPAPSPTNSATPAPVAKDPPTVGTSVGNIVPNFEFTLVDGTKISTAQLSSQGRPVFLFFFATW